MNTIKYPFTKDGVKWFMKNAYDDIFEALGKSNTADEYGDHDIYIKIGCHVIRVPDLADCYEGLEEYLQDCIECYFGE